MPEDMSEYMPEDMPDRMPEDMSDRVPEDMPDRMPEDLPDRMPEDMPEDMPDHMPEDMPDRMSNRMSEDMSDRMPEDLPVRKCINVMVGITRSKVILKRHLTRWSEKWQEPYILCKWEEYDNPLYIMMTIILWQEPSIYDISCNFPLIPSCNFYQRLLSDVTRFDFAEPRDRRSLDNALEA